MGRGRIILPSQPLVASTLVKLYVRCYVFPVQCSVRRSLFVIRLPVHVISSYICRVDLDFGEGTDERRAQNKKERWREGESVTRCTVVITIILFLYSFVVLVLVLWSCRFGEVFYVQRRDDVNVSCVFFSFSPIYLFIYFYFGCLFDFLSSYFG